jgi:hypothetical protein
MMFVSTSEQAQNSPTVCPVGGISLSGSSRIATPLDHSDTSTPPLSTVGVQRVRVAGVPIRLRLHLRPHHSARLRASANEFFESDADQAAGSGDWNGTQVSTGRGSRSMSTPTPGPVPPTLLRSHPPRSITQPSELPSSPLARSSISRAGATYSLGDYNARSWGDGV